MSQQEQYLFYFNAISIEAPIFETVVNNWAGDCRGHSIRGRRIGQKALILIQLAPVLYYEFEELF
ncbi:hypothetical protein ACQKMV_01350 [Lysinibacillus sp. NPDC094403]|uniref:hypothetical protein n=1 Tax=Lysinibacillus sp. NPDC094403 TaxID=3390581 RepID=UPI003D073D13